MRKLLLLLSLTAVCFAGCLDSEEDVTIKTNGSGTYNNTIDMSGLFDMMQMAATMDTSAGTELKKITDRNIDSSFSMRSFTDTAKSLTAEEKALLKNGTVHININQQEKIFKISMSYPFKKMDDLQKILKLQQSDKGFNLFKNSKDAPVPGGMNDNNLPSAEQVTNITYKKGLIERKVDETKLAAAKEKQDTADMKGMEEMMTGVTFGTVIHLPRAVKSATGDKLSVSDDKKTVRVKYTLADMIKDPRALEFKVEY